MKKAEWSFFFFLFFFVLCLFDLVSKLIMWRKKKKRYFFLLFMNFAKWTWRHLLIFMKIAVKIERFDEMVSLVESSEFWSFVLHIWVKTLHFPPKCRTRVIKKFFNDFFSNFWILCAVHLRKKVKCSQNLTYDLRNFLASKIRFNLKTLKILPPKLFQFFLIFIIFEGFFPYNKLYDFCLEKFIPLRLFITLRHWSRKNLFLCDKFLMVPRKHRNHQIWFFW